MRDDELDQLRARIEALEARLASLETHAPPEAATPSAATPRAPHAAHAGFSFDRVNPRSGDTQPSMPRLTEGRLSHRPSPTVLIAGAGAVIFLLGAAYFLHWSIENGLLSPSFRALLGVITGLGLTGAAARLVLREDPRSLGVMVLAAGLGTLMFSLHYAAKTAELIPPLLGFAGVSVTTLLAGGLAARARSGPVLGVAYLAGLAAPVVFSTGRGDLVSLAIYLFVLQGTGLTVFYATRAGANWRFPRVVALSGTWALLLATAADLPRVPELAVRVGHRGLGLAVVGYALAAVWSWLPRHPDRPALAATLWASSNAAFLTLVWLLWDRLDWPLTWMAVPVVVQATACLGLVPLLRARMGGHASDFVSFSVSAALLLVAVPIALDERYIGVSYASFAWALAFGSQLAYQRGAPEALPMKRVAFMVTLAASLAFAVFAFDRRSDFVPILNPAFAAGVLTALAFVHLARLPHGRVAFIGAELVGTIAFALEAAAAVRFFGGTHRAGSVVATLALVASGAIQWVSSLRNPAVSGLAIAGYVWLAIGSAKMLFVDLEDVETPLRALVALGVGAMLLGAAWLGNRLRSASDAQGPP